MLSEISKHWNIFTSIFAVIKSIPIEILHYIFKNPAVFKVFKVYIKFEIVDIITNRRLIFVENK